MPPVFSIALKARRKAGGKVMRKVEAVIFDWDGTMVDYGGFAPTDALARVLKTYGVTLPGERMRLSVERCTIEGIDSVMQEADVNKAWKKKYERRPDRKCLEEIFESVQTQLRTSVKNMTEPLPYVLDTIEILRKKGIKIGATTNYTPETIKGLQSAAKKNGLQPDYSACTEGNRRPYPYMIFENIKHLGIQAVENVIKIGDTVLDVKEGKNAGVFTIGVVEGSAEMGISKANYEVLPAEKRYELSRKVEGKFKKAGADLVVTNLRELPDAIRLIQKI